MSDKNISTYLSKPSINYRIKVLLLTLLLIYSLLFLALFIQIYYHDKTNDMYHENYGTFMYCVQFIFVLVFITPIMLLVSFFQSLKYKLYDDKIKIIQKIGLLFLFNRSLFLYIKDINGYEYIHNAQFNSLSNRSLSSYIKRSQGLRNMFLNTWEEKVVIINYGENNEKSIILPQFVFTPYKKRVDLQVNKKGKNDNLHLLR